MKRLFTQIDRETADLVLTILSSQAIKGLHEKNGPGRFNILIQESDFPRARHHLDLYARENPLPPFSQETAGQAAAPLTSAPFLSPAAIAAALVIALIHLYLTGSGLWSRALFAYGTSPYFLGQGETYRAITALFLHSDAGHLLGNMAGLVLLAGPLTRAAGPGTGLFFLLAAATAGNLVSNSLSMDSRLSIGASTAVMAAAGLLSARQAMGRLPRVSFWQPLAAGLTLTALFSHGPRTDVAAHLLGFAAGTATGTLVFPMFSIWHRPWMEPLGLALTLLITAAAFCSGLPRM